MSQVGGIDYDSEGVYLVLIDEDSGAWLGSHLYDLKLRRKGDDSFDRVRRLQTLLPARRQWADSGVVAIGLEDLRSRQRSQVAAASRVEGALLALLPRELRLVRLSVNAREDNPNGPGWKALTVGKTNASKEEIQAWAIGEGAPAGLVQDFYDAFAIARATRETLNRDRPVAAPRGAR